MDGNDDDDDDDDECLLISLNINRKSHGRNKIKYADIDGVEIVPRQSDEIPSFWLKFESDESQQL